MHKKLTRTVLSAACVIACACGDDDNPTPAGDGGTIIDANVQPPPTNEVKNDSGTVTPVPSIDAGTDAGSTDHVYALHYSVTAEGDNRVSYVYLSKTLDFPERIELSQSREFFGYANSIEASGFLVMSDEGSVMRKWAISSDLKWSEVTSISFASYEDTDDVGFWRQTVVNPTSAFLLHNVTDRLVWNPTEFKILRDVTETTLPLKKDGLDLAFAAHRDPSPSVDYKGPPLRPFGYEGENAQGDWVTSPNSLVVRYEPETYAEAAIYDVPCRSLQAPSQDEQGNTYWSDTGYEAQDALFPATGKAKPCVAKFGPDGVYDPTWTTDFASWTGGRLVGTWRYVRDGIAVGTVLHHEEVTADFTQAPSEATLEELAKHWYLWTFDLKTKTAKQTALKTPVDRGFMSAEFGDRYFILQTPWEPRSEVQNYEVSIDGTVKPAFKTAGGAYTLSEVR
jgi:hypothetical protein